ncbi:DUF3047 domain-containing protein [Polynucleobacter sp. HIN6]|uniref:DUF3047 domain-containing protein n=1 Tax=Polynucleobacter sp. HIN6 TaxID=3047865 RepID=UPI002573F557|nr:DUF3047 domain-containing protein [Polynucleobacter sp. HIN6]
MMRRHTALIPLYLFLGYLLQGCAGFGTDSSQSSADKLDPLVAREDIKKFSAQPANEPLRGWSFYRLAPYKKNTAYRLENYQGRTVLSANAKKSASGLAVKLKPRPSQHLWLEWEWKATGTLDKANNLDRYADDAPLRILVAFDGDRSKLTLKDKMVGELAQIMSGQEMPYATLMYIWSPNGQLNQIKPNSHTNRIKMIAVDAGKENLGQWRKHSRDLTADYEAAYGYAPGNLIGIALLTDTDNTNSETKAYYGDIELKYKNYKPN